MDASVYDHAAQAALEVYNKIFGTSLSGDFEGYLVAKGPGGTVRIFASGEVATLEPNDPEEAAVSYPVDFLDELRSELVRHVVAVEQKKPPVDPGRRMLEDSAKKVKARRTPANRAEFERDLDRVLTRFRETVAKAVRQGEETASLLATRGEELKHYHIRVQDLAFNVKHLKHYLLDVEKTSKLLYLLLDASKTNPKPANLSEICDMVLDSIGSRIGAFENVLHDFVSKLHMLTSLLLWVKEPWAAAVSNGAANMEEVEKEVINIKEDARCIAVPLEG